MATVITSTQAIDIAAWCFDMSILIGTKSSNTIEQYKMCFVAYCEFAGSFADAMQPATLACWRQRLYENGCLTEYRRLPKNRRKAVHSSCEALLAISRVIQPTSLTKGLSLSIFLR